MKSFKLDSNGDVVIKNGNIAMVDGAELTAQTVRTLLGTNKGEWFGNLDEGISFKNILGKNRKSVKENTSGGITSHSSGMTETEELAIAARLRKRLDGDM